MPASVTPSAADFSVVPRTEVHVFRGRRFTFTELTIGEYDELVRAATTKDERTGIESTDDRLLMRLMTMKVVDVSPREYAKLGARVVFGLNIVVRAMHFNDEPDELEKDAEAPEKTDDAGEDAPGNA